MGHGGVVLCRCREVAEIEFSLATKGIAPRQLTNSVSCRQIAELVTRVSLITTKSDPDVNTLWARRRRDCDRRHQPLQCCLPCHRKTHPDLVDPDREGAVIRAQRIANTRAEARVKWGSTSQNAMVGELWNCPVQLMKLCRRSPDGCGFEALGEFAKRSRQNGGRFGASSLHGKQIRKAFG